MLNKEHLGTSGVKSSEWDDVNFAELEAEFTVHVPDTGAAGAEANVEEEGRNAEGTNVEEEGTHVEQADTAQTQMQEE